MSELRSRPWRGLSIALLVLGSGCSDNVSGTIEATCSSHVECSDGVFCNGAETCAPGAEGSDPQGCLLGEPPCLAGRTCVEADSVCITQCDIEPDADGDGRRAGECGGDDCDDGDANRYPGNVEICDLNGHDEDCDLTTFGRRDIDGDGEVDASCCNSTTCGVDCDDLRRSVNTTSSEVCDGFDNNCDGEIDEGVTVTGFIDGDFDGVGDAAQVMACSTQSISAQGDDCDDDNPAVRPRWVELCDGIDNDCNGEIDDGAVDVAWYFDGDGDGWGVTSSVAPPIISCTPIAGYALLLGDCDDDDPAVHPAAPERCNGQDDDCNGLPDFVVGPGDTEDDDGDGVADALCGASMADCDDADPFTYPGASEICDLRDNDCNGQVDDGTSMVRWYLDGDGDTYGDATASSLLSCTVVPGRVTRSGDCDDADPLRHPGVVDGCASRIGLDDDCDGDSDEDALRQAIYADPDGDGWGSGAPILACLPGSDLAALPGDCDEANPDRHPGADERCAAQNGIDDDCDGFVDCVDPDCASEPSCNITCGLAILQGAGQAAVVGAFLPVPIQVQVTTPMGEPLGLTPVRLASTTSAVATSTTVITDEAGIAEFYLRAPPRVGTERVAFAASCGLPVRTVVEAVAPPEGEIFSLLNATKAPGFSGIPGPALAAQVNSPADIAVAADGTIYVSLPVDHRVIAIDSVGYATVLAGTGVAASTGDRGPAAVATLNTPSALALDEARQFLYVAEEVRTGRVRRVDLTTGSITTVAGGGSVGAPTYGDGGPATAAMLDRPHSVAVDRAGNFYVADRLRDGIRAIDGRSGIISTAVAPGSTVRSLLGLSPQLLGCNTPCVGRTCQALCSVEVVGDEVIVMAVLVDPGNLRYPALLELGPEPVPTTSGVYWVYPGASDLDGTPAESWIFYQAVDMTVDAAGSEYFSFGPENAVRRINRVTGRSETIVGGSGAGFSGDGGPATAAKLSNPARIHIDADNYLYIADRGNHAVRVVRLAADPTLTLSLVSGGGQLTTIGAEPVNPVVVGLERPDGSAVDNVRVEVSGPVGAGPFEAVTTLGEASLFPRVSMAAGPQTFTATAVDRFGKPVSNGLTFSANAVDPPAGTVLPVFNAGRVSTAGDLPTAGALASGASAEAIAVAADGTVYVALDALHMVVRIRPNGLAERFAGTGQLNQPLGDGRPARDAAVEAPRGLALDEVRNVLYISHTNGGAGGITYVRAVDLSTGLISTYAGGNRIQSAPYGDGELGPRAQLSTADVLAVAQDGTLFIADNGIGRLRAVSAATGRISTLASPTVGGMVGLAAQGDDVLVLITNTGGTNVLFRYERNGMGTQIAGTTFGSTADGIPATMATLGIVSGLAVSPSGEIYIAAREQHRIRRIDAMGNIYTAIGTGVAATTGDYGPANAATVHLPGPMDFGRNGRLYFADRQYSVVRMIW